VLGRWGADYPDPDNLAKAFGDFDSRVLAWRNQWDNPVKNLVKQAVVERDRAKREQMYKDIQRTILNEGPYVIFGYQTRLIAMRSSFFSASAASYEPPRALRCRRKASTVVTAGGSSISSPGEPSCSRRPAK